MNSINHVLAFMKRAAFIPSLLALAAMMSNGCDLVDPTQVRNPLVTPDNLAGQLGSTTAALQGVRGRFSSMVSNTAYFTDCVSDNYQNVATFISPNVDFPKQVLSGDLTLNGGGSMYVHAEYLRFQADFALNTIVPADPSPAAGLNPQIAELTFYRGAAYLVLGENFSYAPVAAGAQPISSNALLALAIADFTTAYNATGGSATIKTAAQYALARANRQAGNLAAAVTAATAALGLDPNFVFLAQYDAVSTIPGTNVAWNFVVSRNLNDMQPLPRLDFLDPKYTSTTGVSPIPFLKSEEANLILAEAALSAGDTSNATGAKRYMKAAITTAKSTANGRTVVAFTDPDPRSNAAYGPRPNADTIFVKADANSPARAGLVKKRSGTLVNIKQISNTSLNTADVDTLTQGSSFLWMINLLRQEIFFLEGRRMCDLGIRLPMMQRDIDASVVTAFPIHNGDAGTAPLVPAYIPAAAPGNAALDKFTINSPVAGTTTILNDMNLVIATNKISPFPMPFTPW